MKPENKVSHTPGPWRVQWLSEPFAVTDEETGQSWVSSYEMVFAEEGRVAECRSSSSGVDVRSHLTMRANAELIAAAPELLEALKQIADITYSPNESKDLTEDALKINRIAISAITKAKGGQQ